MALFSSEGASTSGENETAHADVQALLAGYSIEVTPRTATKIESFGALLPARTRVYIAHIDGTPIDAMIATARRLTGEGFTAMPHIPARFIKDRETLADWIARYQGEAGVDQALLIAGDAARPRGEFHSSMQLMETGLFDAAGFTRLHVAGHPEGCRSIGDDGSNTKARAALRWTDAFRQNSDADMALVTQFCFEAAPVIAWTEMLKASGIDIPVHVGVAGPAKLQTLIRFALACGVGPSLRVLQRRAGDIGKLVKPFEPTALISDLVRHCAANPDSNIQQIHFFPLGGIRPCADWANKRSGAVFSPAA
ncbi:MAG: methylenetetrahydrofolate reductase [Alphaproteobacteria bacterium]